MSWTFFSLKENNIAVQKDSNKDIEDHDQVNNFVCLREFLPTQRFYYSNVNHDHVEFARFCLSFCSLRLQWHALNKHNFWYTSWLLHRCLENKTEIIRRHYKKKYLQANLSRKQQITINFCTMKFNNCALLLTYIHLMSLPAFWSSIK